MSVSVLTLISLGLLFIVGFVADTIGRSTPIPRVSVLILFGLCIGPAGLNLLPESIYRWMPVVSDIALAVIGFLLGSSLKYSSIKKYGRVVFYISLSVVAVTAVLVGCGLWIAGMSLSLAVVYAGIAPATDPAATLEVVRESERTGEFPNVLLQITAIDDAWGVMLFSLLFAGAQLLVAGTGGGAGVLEGGREILLSLLIGIGLGVPMSFLTGRIQPGEPSLAEALGMVFICCGISIWVEASYLLSSMVMGTVVANLASHHERPFYAIEGIEWPVVILFFIFAGVNIRIEHLSGNLMWILLYIGLRILGRLTGSAFGAVMSGQSFEFGKWMGVALMPQAGVALGMALTAAHRFEVFEPIVSVVAVTTVFFEVVGPVCARFALKKMNSAAAG
ncbi:cation:proton antiporter [Maridesulfovibrio sp. FT414]|uniref:cation:proton antiporter n=1 Tax=Maridesulfovibrio sp. FT414 TaxID=2979469 RepID=UPI003D801354